MRTSIALALAIFLIAPGNAWAHRGPPPAPHEIWSSWSWEPGVLLAIGLAALLYARGVGRLWRRAGAGRGIARWRFHCFVLGLCALFVALVSPLDALGTALFSAHMVQHEVLMLVAAPLLVVGLPTIAVLWALPLAWRRRIGTWSRSPTVRGASHLVFHPVTAWSIYAAALWIWHLPALYQSTLRTEWIHVAQHGSFLGAALLFWWVLLHPTRLRRKEYGVAIPFVFTTAVHGSLLGALLTFAKAPWYPAYAVSAQAWGLSPLDDQQLGGLIMWIPPGFLYLGIAMLVLTLWLRRIEAGDARRLNRAAALCIVLLAGCADHGPDVEPATPLVYGGEPEAGRELINQYGCGTCHVIPGIRSADGRVGPPLTDFAYRAYIAGNLANTPENLVAWIMAPDSIEPGTAMPTLGVSAASARHIAAYIYSAR